MQVEKKSIKIKFLINIHHKTFLYRFPYQNESNLCASSKTHRVEQKTKRYHSHRYNIPQSAILRNGFAGTEEKQSLSQQTLCFLRKK